MSFFWWFFGSLFITLCIYYLYASAPKVINCYDLQWPNGESLNHCSQVASDRHIVKRRLRNGAVLRGNQPVVRTNQETVIYTIPTTSQLAQQYPQMVTPYPHQHGGPPHHNNGPPPYIGKWQNFVRVWKESLSSSFCLSPHQRSAANLWTGSRVSFHTTAHNGDCHNNSNGVIDKGCGVMIPFGRR